MNWGSQAHSGRWIASIVLTVVVGIGCRTTEKDVRRWANTQQGPRKLVAVLQHDKYPDELRVDAAVTLVSMKPRQGRRVGIERLVDTLADMPSAERKKILAGVVPVLIKELSEAPPEEPGALDTTIPYKDSAYELLTYEGTDLIEDPAREKALRKALIGWAMADFSGRMDAPAQNVGMEQLIRLLGAEGARALPELIEPEAPKIGRIASLVAEVGDQTTKEEASKRLVAVAKEVGSQAWLDRKAPAVKQANEESNIKVDEERFKAQLARFQEEELMRVFASMKRVNGKAAIDYLLTFAGNDDRPRKLRAGALAALEGHLDKKNKQHIERILALAKDDDTPDLVRDLALRRIGEMPRDQVVVHLYKLFDNDNWKVRWAAAEHVLKMSEAEHLQEFMKRLRRVENMAISEPLRYGKLIGELKGEPEPASVIDKYAAKRAKKPVRFTALGYYYAHGTQEQLDKVSAYTGDDEKVPECAEDAKDCEWKCADQELETLGDFVKYCVLPAMKARKKAPEAKPSKKDPAKASPVDGKKK